MLFFFKKLIEVFEKYKLTFKIANIKRKSYFFVFFLTFLTVILDAAGIGILLPIGEYVLNYEKGGIPDTFSWRIIKNVFGYLGIIPNITLIVASIALIIIFRQVISFSRAILVDIIRLKAVKDFRDKLFIKFLRQDVYYIKKYSTGVYNNIINLEVDKIGLAIILPLDNISGIILLASYLFLMMLVSVKATLIVLFCIILIGIFLKSILYYIKNMAGKIIKINNQFSQNLVDRLFALKLIRVNNMLDKEQLNNKKILKNQFINNLKLSRIQKLVDSSIEPLLLMIAIPVIFTAIKLNFPLAKLGVFIVLLARCIPVFKTTIIGFQNYATYFASVTNILDLIEKINYQKEVRHGYEQAPKKIESINFKNVCFQYLGEDKEVIKNFSCQIKGEQINAIIGPSGSGKTTLVNMIPRLLEPKNGVIEINNKPINKIKVSSIRDLCSYIEQKPSFIRGTITEHLTYNNENISYEKAVEAAKLANAHDFIMGLQNNYDYILGESGVGLSGGQLQRLDITRGLISNKPLMILDEPTNNLDKHNAEEILETLKNINNLRQTTIIIVTHDQNVLKYCDNIIKV